MAPDDVRQAPTQGDGDVRQAQDTRLSWPGSPSTQARMCSGSALGSIEVTRVLR
ncbi:MAG: hypothetical protein QOD10_4486 [Mycobacterium sp.]|jgi:hypothetical protein|nr:hypothetical protein [Mycobacterium sp.]